MATQEADIQVVEPEPAGPTGVLVGVGGDPLIVGLIFFAIAALALGMALVQMPTSSLTAVIPIILAGAGLYQLITTVWAIILGQSIVAAIFSTFAAFWWSLSLLLFGLTHNWFGATAADAAGFEELYFIVWACLFLCLTIPCLKLPLAYPLAIFLVFVACALSAIGIFEPQQSDWLTAAGASALTFSFIAFYSWMNVALTAVGAKPVPPLGKPPWA